MAFDAEANDEQFWAELPSALQTDMALKIARPLSTFFEISTFWQMPHAYSRSNAFLQR